MKKMSKKKQKMYFRRVKTQKSSDIYELYPKWSPCIAKHLAKQYHCIDLLRWNFCGFSLNALLEEFQIGVVFRTCILLEIIPPIIAGLDWDFLMANIYVLWNCEHFLRAVLVQVWIWVQELSLVEGSSPPTWTYYQSRVELWFLRQFLHTLSSLFSFRNYRNGFQ